MELRGGIKKAFMEWIVLGWPQQAAAPRATTYLAAYRRRMMEPKKQQVTVRDVTSGDEKGYETQIKLLESPSLEDVLLGNLGQMEVKMR